MSEARALTSIISNCVASVVVAIWENACDRAVLASELSVNFEKTEQALDEGRLVDATLAVTEQAAVRHA
jgi:Na+/H+-dicarboxylate symporter